MFNVGQLRRSRARQRALTCVQTHSHIVVTKHSFHDRSGQRESHTAEYFSHSNEEATRLRDKLAEDSLDMLIQWLKDGGNVGIHGEYFANF